jgi:hypothetical protein
VRCRRDKTGCEPKFLIFIFLSFFFNCQLYVRCRRDKTGCEPKRLYNLIEFMINDKDGGGTINEDEIMEVLYHR